VICDLGHTGGHVRRYHVDMPADGKGAKGGEVMTRTHAMGSALTYAKRYLLLQIFALAIGEPDDDGDAAGKGDVIGEEQIDTINKLIVETNSNIALFLKYVGVPSVADIPAKEFARIVALLERKRTQP
jgi:hypothetical protein